MSNWTEIYRNAGVEYPLVENNKLYFLYPDGKKVFIKDIDKAKNNIGHIKKNYRIDKDGKWIEKED